MAVLGTVGLYLYFHRSKVSEVAKDAKDLHLPRHKDIKASGRGSDAPAASSDAPGKRGSYYAESGSAPGAVAQLLYPHLDKSEKEDLENIAVPHNHGVFGKTMKQAAVADQMKRNRDVGEQYKGPEGRMRGTKPTVEGGSLLGENEHLTSRNGHKGGG